MPAGTDRCLINAGSVMFNSKAFMKEKFRYRIEEVKVPDLAAWFDEGDPPVWKVRGLEGSELGFVNETANRNKNISAILEGMLSQDDQTKAQAVKALLGISGDTPEDIARRLEMLRIGSVEPACSMDLAIRLCKAFPIEFYQLTNKITALTGQGQVRAGESIGSGEILASESA
jgi:hypothetical protein